MIPWGRWHPDREQVDRSAIVLKAINVRPVSAGFAPWPSLVGYDDTIFINRIVDSPTGLDFITDRDGNYLVTSQSDLSGNVGILGATSFIDGDGNIVSFAGTAKNLYKL